MGPIYLAVVVSAAAAEVEAPVVVVFAALEAEALVAADHRGVVALVGSLQTDVGDILVAAVAVARLVAAVDLCPVVVVAPGEDTRLVAGAGPLAFLAVATGFVVEAVVSLAVGEGTEASPEVAGTVEKDIPPECRFEEDTVVAAAEADTDPTLNTGRPLFVGVLRCSVQKSNSEPVPKGPHLFLLWSYWRLVQTAQHCREFYWQQFWFDFQTQEFLAMQFLGPRGQLTAFPQSQPAVAVVVDHDSLRTLAGLGIHNRLHRMDSVAGCIGHRHTVVGTVGAADLVSAEEVLVAHPAVAIGYPGAGRAYDVVVVVAAAAAAVVEVSRFVVAVVVVADGEDLAVAVAVVAAVGVVADAVGEVPAVAAAGVPAVEEVVVFGKEAAALAENAADLSAAKIAPSEQGRSFRPPVAASKSRVSAEALPFVSSPQPGFSPFLALWAAIDFGGLVATTQTVEVVVLAPEAGLGPAKQVVGL